VLKVIVTDLKKERARLKSARRNRPQHSGNELEPRRLDVTSPTFDDDLTEVFKRNIAKARRQNKKLLGSADGF
jgi:hypothetical protein